MLAKGGVGASNLTPLALQELEVDDSPPYVWPTATTGHMSLSPIHQPSPADTAELIEYVHILENTRSIGVNPIPELIPLPLSPIIHANAGVNTDDVPVRAEEGVNTYEVTVLQPSDIQVPIDNLLGLSGSVTPLSPNDAPLSSVDKFYELIDEGLIPPLPQSQWLLDALNGPMPDKDWWKAKDSLEGLCQTAGVAVMDAGVAGQASESAGVPGQAVMDAGDALNTPLPPSPGSDLFEDGEGLCQTAGVAGQAVTDIVTAITTIM